MGIRDITKRILEMVEKQSGLPVYVHQDASIANPATVKIARGNIPFHTVVFNPNSNIAPDYFICWECGFIFRLFQVPKDARKEIALNNNIKAILYDRFSNLPNSLIGNLINGVLLQLRSYSVGFRVAEWLYNDFPDIRDLQEQSIRKELENNLPALEPGVKSFFPEEIYNLNIIMNSAYAFFCSGIFRDPSIKLPYEKLSQAAKANKLLELYKELPDSPLYDCTLIDGWASELGIAEWYKWIDYKSDF